MAITLVTGLPGNGKTLWTVTKYKAAAEGADARPVYYNGIKDLKLPWVELADVTTWQDLPPNSLVIIDEVQRVMPIRGRGEPPAWIGALAMHRHLGLDFVLITQDPGLLDVFVRKLVQTHYHVVRKFGSKFATIHEWPTGVYDQCGKNSKGSIRHEWRFPKSSFGLYHSADAHTMKVRIPMRVWILGALPFLIAACVWGVMRRADDRLQGKPVDGAVVPGQSASAPASGGEVEPGVRPVGARGLVVTYRPRVAGLPHTAPAYDHLTVPVEAPYPAYCVSIKPVMCTCYSQRNTRLAVPAGLCEQIAVSGFFADWVKPLGVEGAPASSQVTAAPAASAPAREGVNGG